MTNNRSILFNTKDAAEFIGIKGQTLATWRMNGIAEQPPYIRVGRRAIRYRQSDLLMWLEQRRRDGDARDR